MSIPALNWAFSAHVEPSSAKFILVALANYADEDGHCYPSQRRLARDTGQGERSVRRQLAKLEHDGWITRCKRRRKNGSHTSDAFDLDMQNSHRPSVPAANLAAGQSKQDQRPNGAEPAANLAAPEPSVEPPEEPSSARARPLALRAGPRHAAAALAASKHPNLTQRPSGGSRHATKGSPKLASSGTATARRSRKGWANGFTAHGCMT